MPHNLFLKNAVLNDAPVDILILDGKFSRIAPDLTAPEGIRTIDCGGRYAVTPAFYNTHTHAAMTLMRGYADDYELFQWLNGYIWPAEAKLTHEDVYNGSRLAILEMIRSGTVFFNDMYWHQSATVQAVQEMGVRACIGMLKLTIADMARQRENELLWERRKELGPMIQVSFAPHAIYSVTEAQFRDIAEKSHANNAYIHIHLAETQKEFDDCMKEHGMTPVEYLDSLGILTPKTICAHSIYLAEHGMQLLGQRGCTLSNMPISNMKLASGCFRYPDLAKYKCKFTLGTDGASSNNNLSMLEEMKVAAILAKYDAGSPEILPADEIFHTATRQGALAFGIDAGIIEEGRLADCLLVDLDHYLMVPNHHLISNLVYSAESACIDSVICDGKVLMLHHEIPGEEEILAKARESARRVCGK